MQQRAERTRSEILLASEMEFSDKGFSGARVDEIAARAGVNKNLIYKYFGNKESLYKTVFVIVYDRFSKIEQEIFTFSDCDYRTRIKKFVEMEFKYCMENPTYVRLIMWENLNHAKFFNKDELTVSKGEILNWVKKIVEDAEKEGRLMKSIDAKQLLLTLYACCFNYFTNMNTLSGIIGCDLMKEEEIEKRITAVTDLLIAYLEHGEKV